MRAPQTLPPGEARLAHWQVIARKAGVKLTHQRLEIFRELAAHEDHPDAEAVYRAVSARLPTVSLDTVYRTLWLLNDLGLLTTLGPRRDAIRFDLNLDPHHHFVCVRCGLVRDLPADSFAAVSVPDAVRQLGGVLEARVEVRGICARCQEQRSAPTATDHDPNRRDEP